LQSKADERAIQFFLDDKNERCFYLLHVHFSAIVAFGLAKGQDLSSPDGCFSQGECTLSPLVSDENRDTIEVIW